MKVRCILILFVCLVLVSSCKKDKPLESNINLIGQPLSVIERYTKGNYKMLYSYGGLGFGKTEYNNYYIRISEDTLTWTINDAIFLHGKINWQQDFELNHTKTYMMTFQGPGAYPYILAPTQVKDGLLVLCDEITDGYSYYLSRIP
ncbi:hypothetical protein SAMN05428988_3211 [Chitinophaga sp. YR573]|uniref:hypothetical protein n=1 Tax=Chitinophaga sp. YR573 TaxID=1881040 RepID=UPI0008D39402|nr:hypothetical protein [Chitinophaga sp. YR573]SEW21445.1 hypothetical protein SAMN05428988_3211 [Chitinophaga sp. YR573]